MLYEIVSTEHIMHQLPSDTYWKMLLLLEGGGGGGGGGAFNQGVSRGNLNHQENCVFLKTHKSAFFYAS